ncbi:TPA: hypothetical protein RZK30_000863, partial [Campylobacter coli]|nr:hypothetical protein [Campylobacter coli]HEB9323453.1 hypothetical protein [Campylobacter coli]
MHRLDVPPVELLSRQYNLKQELKMKEEQIQNLNQTTVNKTNIIQDKDK